MQDKLVFVLGPPRSGSTLLMRMLSSHSQIFSRPEPHLLTPLAHLGYWDNVDRASFDQLQAAAPVAAEGQVDDRSVLDGRLKVAAGLDPLGQILQGAQASHSGQPVAK